MDKTETPTMLIDTKKGRIRVYKSVIHQIGNPKAILLLINPKTLCIAVKATDSRVSSDQTHLISASSMFSTSSVEFYSKTLIAKIRETVCDMKDDGSYKVTGNIIENKKMAVFSLKTIERI